jgi:hypothetical protein
MSASNGVAADRQVVSAWPAPPQGNIRLPIKRAFWRNAANRRNVQDAWDVALTK